MIALLHYPEDCSLYINSVSSKGLKSAVCCLLNKAPAAKIEQTSASAGCAMGRAALAGEGGEAEILKWLGLLTHPFLEEEKWKHQNQFAAMDGGRAVLEIL